MTKTCIISKVFVVVLMSIGSVIVFALSCCANPVFFLNEYHIETKYDCTGHFIDYNSSSYTFQGQDSYYGTQGQRRVTKDTPNDGQIVFTFTFAPGNNNGTSVEDGQIPELRYYT